MKTISQQLLSNKEIEGKTIKEAIRCGKVMIFICDDNTHFIVDGLRVHDVFDYQVGISIQSAHEILGDRQPIPTLPSKTQSILVNKLGYENAFKFPIYYCIRSSDSGNLKVEYGVITENSKSTIIFINKIPVSFTKCSMDIMNMPECWEVYLDSKVESSKEVWDKSVSIARRHLD